MKTYKYQTIQAFQRARAPWWRVGILIVWACGLLLMGFFAISTHQKTSQVGSVKETDGGVSSAELLSTGNEQVWGEWHTPLWEAIRRWKKVGLKVPTVKLIANPHGCPLDAVACWDAEHGTIFIADFSTTLDKTTIMMHEVGHVLGVPHIDGDPLMDPSCCATPLEYPSEDAIAIAKLRQPYR
jgi:hypothetical protein